MSCAVITYCTLARSGGIAVGTGGAARLGHPAAGPNPRQLRGAVRNHHRRPVRHDRPAAHAPVRDDPGAACRDIRRRAEARLHEPPRHVPKPHHRAGRDDIPYDLVAAAHSGLLRHYRRGRRRGGRLARGGPRVQAAPRMGPGDRGRRGPPGRRKAGPGVHGGEPDLGSRPSRWQG